MDYIKKFSNLLHQNLQNVSDSPLNKMDSQKKLAMGANSDKSKKEIEKTLITLNFELIILLAKNSQLHQKLIECQFTKNLVNCMEKINRVGTILFSGDSIDAKKRVLTDYGLVKEDIYYFERILCFLFFQVSHYRKFDEDIKVEGFRFLINQLCNPSNINRTTAFNSIKNILKLRKGAHINALIEVIDRFLHSYNTKALVSKMEQNKFVELFGVMAMLEYLYEEYDVKPEQKIKPELLESAGGEDQQESEQRLAKIKLTEIRGIKEGEIAYIIPYLLSDVLVEKFEIDLPVSVLDKMMMLALCDLRFRCRLLFLLYRHVYAGTRLRHRISQYVEKIVELIDFTLKMDLKEVLQEENNFAEDFTYAFYGEYVACVLETGIEQLDGASSLEHVFFWEFFNEDHE